jgi:UV DNA damage endonuclease
MTHYYKMIKQHVKRIGFACKWSELDPKKGVISTEGLNTGGTTLTWAKRQTSDVAEQKMYEIMERNITNTFNLVSKVGTLAPELRMVRLTSDMLSFYTHDDWKYFWKKPDVIHRMQELFAKVGEAARAHDVRLSMHPGQFTVLASVNENIVEKSIEEFEYHADMVRWMGYGKQFQDFKINVHISGKQGPQGIIDVLPRLSPEARNCITIENDEMSWGIEDSIVLSKHCALVLDIHHHWIRTGEYIQPTDDRCKRVIDSWRGVRPAMHYSVSHEDILVDHDPDTLPDMQQLLLDGHKKQKLRAHSQFYWNTAANDWALTFLDNFDIMCESKGKNLASFALYDRYKMLTGAVKNVEQTKEPIQKTRRSRSKNRTAETQEATSAEEAQSS